MLRGMSSLLQVAASTSRRANAMIAPKIHALAARHQSTLRAYPSHTIYGETCILNLQMLTPGFKVLKNNLLTQDSQRKGRLILEFIPRNADGRIIRDDLIRFALSPEEVAVLVEKSSKAPVHLYRSPPSYGMTSTPDELPEKALHVIPEHSSGNGSVLYKVDYELNGVGGQIPPPTNGPEPPAAGPLSVTAQLGEHLVMMELMRHAIPIITGWSTTIDVALRSAEHEAVNNKDYGHTGGVPF